LNDEHIWDVLGNVAGDVEADVTPIFRSHR